MEIELDEPVITSGMTLHGRMTVTFVERVTVKLQAYEASFPKPVTMAEVEALATNGYEFALKIPANAVDFALERATVTWKLTAKEGGITGHDLEHPISIVAPLDADVADREIDEILEASRKKHRNLGVGEMATTALFMLMGLGLLGTGIVTAIVPPESFNDSLTPAYVMMAMSLFFFVPGFIRVRSVYRPAGLAGVETLNGMRSVRRGDELIVQLTLSTDAPLRVGYVATAGMFKELWGAQYGRTPKGGGYVFKTFHESWQLVEGANPTLSFIIPIDIAPTYTGRVIYVMHHIRVQSAKSTSTKWNTRRLEVPVAVLP